MKIFRLIIIITVVLLLQQWLYYRYYEETIVQRSKEGTAGRVVEEVTYVEIGKRDKGKDDNTEIIGAHLLKPLE